MPSEDDWFLYLPLDIKTFGECIDVRYATVDRRDGAMSFGSLRLHPASGHLESMEHFSLSHIQAASIVSAYVDTTLARHAKENAQQSEE